jgi:hypothetical protein
MQFLSMPLENLLLEPIGMNYFLPKHELSTQDDGEPYRWGHPPIRVWAICHPLSSRWYMPESYDVDFEAGVVEGVHSTFFIVSLLSVP